MLDLLLESALRSLALGGAVWLGLRLLRVRNPRVHMTAWTVVLAASLSMPVLMHRLTLTLPAAAPHLRVLESLPALSGPRPDAPGVPAQDPLALSPAAEPAVVPPPRQVTSVPPDRRGPDWPGFDWRALATAIYLLVAGALLLRLFTGVRLSRRIARAARPIHDGWAGHADVRVSGAVGVPVTFGSIILLPAEYVDWSDAKRQAVLSHEGSHVVHGDFYVLLLATFNRAVFWFSPFAWWQLVRLTELAEIISDDAALETLDDRPSYAGILLDVAGGLQRAPVAVAMARASTVRERVERILAGTAVSARMDWRKRALVVTALAPAVIISGGAIAFSTSKPPAEPAAVVTEATQVDAAAAKQSAEPFYERADHARSPAAIDVAPNPSDRYVGYYKLAPLRALAVTREGDRLLLQETGSPKFEVIAHSDREFVSSDATMFVTFKSDAPGNATELLLRRPGWAARRAVRIDADRARAIEDAFARQIAAAPDRFRDQVPADGSKAALLRVIDELQRGAPRYERMSEQLADNVRRQISQLHEMITAVGAVESVFFRGVGPGGFDIYGAKFAGGFAEFRILAGSDGHVEDMVFRPGGDDTHGGVVTCAQEPALKSLPRTAPIRLVLYNSSGVDVRVVELDSDGKRSRNVMIGDDRSAPILTYVGHPWVVTDTSGQCIEIVMPGQSTRFLAITPNAREQAVRSAARRASPMPGSEQALRRYIDALGRGEPNYDEMTPEVAAETRQQLMLDRAILARLGALRAMSFRGVTPLDSDVYIVQFADGSAEWRIGLVKQGRIGRIALGPQY
jgi:hypothetical protein